MEEKIEIMNLLQNKQVLEHELQTLAYGSVEIRENNSNKYKMAQNHDLQNQTKIY